MALTRGSERSKVDEEIRSVSLVVAFFADGSRGLPCENRKAIGKKGKSRSLDYSFLARLRWGY